MNIIKLLSQMTIEEKLGQLTQFGAGLFIWSKAGNTGPLLNWGLKDEDLCRMGSILNFNGAEEMIDLQKTHMEGDRNKIPMLFMMDVIHGYCANIKSNANKGAIVFKACHDSGGEDYPAGVHENINIHNNKFIDLPHSAIYISAAKNVKITNNVFENCCCKVKNSDSPYAYHDIVTVNCENILVTDNVTSRSEDKLYINAVID